VGIIKPVFTSFFFSWRGRTHYIRLRLSISQIRPTQSIMYVPLLVNRFGKIIFVIVQYKYLKSCSEDFMLRDLILRTRLCGTGLFVNIVELLISTRPKWSGGNILYQLGTSSQRANRRGWPLNIFTWFIGAGGTVIRSGVSGFFSHPHTHRAMTLTLYLSHSLIQTHTLFVSLRLRLFLWGSPSSFHACSTQPEFRRNTAYYTIITSGVTYFGRPKVNELS